MALFKIILSTCIMQLTQNSVSYMALGFENQTKTTGGEQAPDVVTAPSYTEDTEWLNVRSTQTSGPNKLTQLDLPLQFSEINKKSTKGKQLNPNNNSSHNVNSSRLSLFSEESINSTMKYVNGHGETHYVPIRDLDKILGIDTRCNTPTKMYAVKRYRRFVSKQKRFMSNLKSTLKKHLKNRVGNWATSRKEAKKMFGKYYQCISDRLKLLRKEEFPIKAFMAVEGERVMMECTACYRPDVDAASQRAKWQVLNHEATKVHAVQPSKKIIITKDSSLIIEDIDLADAGQYYCTEKHDYLAIYQLDVFLTDKRKHVKIGHDEPRPVEYLMNRNLRVFTTWTAWSECSTCDRPGRRLRVGQCTVKKIYSDLPIFPKDFPLMMLYPDGVPCHSTALPRHIRRLYQVSGRYSETLVVPCMEACPTEPPARVITDRAGKVLEILEPGFYSVKEKPVVPKLVKRKVLYEEAKSHLILHCPGDLNKHLVHWARGTRTIDISTIKRQTKGRIRIDSQARLHFMKLLASDTSVYNCWVKDRRVASIKLIVVDATNKNIKIYISYGGLALLIIGTFVLVFCMCCNQKQHIAR